METNFTLEKIKQAVELLQKKMVLQSIPVTGWRFTRCAYKKGNSLPNPNSENFSDFPIGSHWDFEGEEHGWLMTHIDIPEEWSGKDVRFCLDGVPIPQIIAYIDGIPYQGMDMNHTELFLQGKNSLDLALYIYANYEVCKFSPSIRLYCPDCEKLYYDLKVPVEILEITDKSTKTYGDLLHVLNTAVNHMNCLDPNSEAFHVGNQAAIAYLKEALYDKADNQSDKNVVCIGQTHIDVAWLWTLEQTKEKVQRSFSTVLRLMERYPEYKFMSSQAQLYKYLKQEAPDLYEQVKEMVRQGRWEVEGAMWVEADCNLSSGESLVRQILHGKRFFYKEFGIDCKVLWLPDVFGYSAALPQILKKSGIESFITSKISWNETNKMPNDMFSWRGIDGSEIFTYFLTAQKMTLGQEPARYTVYNSNTSPAQIAGTWNRFHPKSLTNQVLNSFGFGDGGGGPTAQMLELRRRMENSIGEIPAAPIGTVTEFLKNVKSNISELPQWCGELYLELHRGTYTSIAANKRNNRKCEFAYQNAEFAASMDKLLLGGHYPKDQLNQGWERILLYQFHDIIPGSSIKEVYEDCDRIYPQVLNYAETVSQEALEHIAKQVDTSGGILVVNPNSFGYSDIIRHKDKLYFAENIPAKGYAVITPKKPDGTVLLSDHGMENKFYRIKFDEHYNICSLYDKRVSREVIDISKGPGNRLEAYEDFPKYWDAWEISDYYREKCTTIDDVQTVVPIHDGARSGFQISRNFLSSTIVQTIWLYEDTPKLEFETEVDWKQEHILLKAAFPVTVNSTRATYDIQFGTIERPTHTNTSWDEAKFEVCAHKFCDLAEFDYGVALLNDCKYGHDVHDGVMRLSLLKSATWPSTTADRCHHTFTYALVPHVGDYRTAGIIQMAYAMNNPMSAIELPAQHGTLPEQYSLVRLSQPNVILETIKEAENGTDLVLRMHEAWNKTSDVEITLGFTPKRIYETDLMENTVQEIPFTENSFHLRFTPFDLRTIKIEL